MSNLPPNQMATERFPLIGARDVEPFDPATWRLEISGLVEEPLSLTLNEFRKLPHALRTGTIHCVTRWSRPNTTFAGVRFETIEKRVRPLAQARFVRFAAASGHDTSLPLEACRGDVLLADNLEEDGVMVPVPPEHGGPLRSVTFKRYFYKSVKWLRSIEFLAQDRLGFWERTAGYHNGGDPWKEERYVVRGVDGALLRRLLDARDLSGQDLLNAPLRGADLAGMNLRGALLRHADLRETNLRGADLTGANLTNADMRRADMRDSVIEGADLDGADLRGADMRRAMGSPLGAMATEFVTAGGDDSDGARVDGLGWPGLALGGLLPEQEEYLRRQGVHLPPRV